MKIQHNYKLKVATRSWFLTVVVLLQSVIPIPVLASPGQLPDKRSHIPQIEYRKNVIDAVEALPCG